MRKKLPRVFKIGHLAAVAMAKPACKLPSVCTLKTTCGDSGSSLNLCRAGGSWLEYPDRGDDVEIAVLVREMRMFARNFRKGATGVAITAKRGRVKRIQAVLAREKRRRG
jgi:hypothetical protein